LTRQRCDSPNEDQRTNQKRPEVDSHMNHVYGRGNRPLGVPGEALVR